MVPMVERLFFLQHLWLIGKKVWNFIGVLHFSPGVKNSF